MTSYTITAHSGLGALDVEVCSVSGDSDRRAVTRAGGALFDTYSQAELVCSAVVRYSSPSDICPAGVHGSFATTLVRGLPLWVPDQWAAVLLAVADENGYALPADALADLADAITATPATERR